MTISIAHIRFSEFLRSLCSTLHREGQDEVDLVASAKPLLEELVEHDDWLDDEFARPDPNVHRQNLLYCDPLCRFSVVSFVWGPGQQTPIHDHTTWGIVGVLRGAEVSENFVMRAGRLDLVDIRRLEPGEATVVGPSFGDIHRVRNALDDRVSISIHVYGGNIGAIERNLYSEDGARKTFVSGYSNRRLPNVWRKA